MIGLASQSSNKPCLVGVVPTARRGSPLSRVSAVAKEQGYPLMTGKTDPATGLPKFIASLKAAGMDTIVAEAQKQYDAWKATQK